MKVPILQTALPNVAAHYSLLHSALGFPHTNTRLFVESERSGYIRYA